MRYPPATTKVPIYSKAVNSFMVFLFLFYSVVLIVKDCLCSLDRFFTASVLVLSEDFIRNLNLILRFKSLVLYSALLFKGLE